MKNIGTIINENKAEAQAILNIMTNQGKNIVSFINELEGTEDTEINRREMLIKAGEIGNDIDSDCPCVIVSLCDDIEDAYVYAITGNMDILVNCPNSGCTVWLHTSDCCNYSENDIYMHLDAIFND